MSKTKENLDFALEIQSNGNKIYTCTLNSCGKQYSRKSRLNIHCQKIHYNSYKKHYCSLCLKIFRDKSTWAIHMKIHAGVRDY